MAILLVHLRRLILLMSVVYLSGALVRKLLSDARHAYILQWNGKMTWSKQLHFQYWAYIYTIYTYLLLVNSVSVRRFTNLLEYFLT
ncbi:uncharacterized protein LOC119674795 [Teleopsis dalmanni]|uniref:uncharacterized protein LOC119672394 n=1 Tax=Teleopsis dalmanni TaxID=139649 RepID=UPI0018CF45EE|nr:uncharacterized protein LOC119672394 [Teleopsis dalmanni]XP_037941881.1 uncharacterized protein LOC119674795 [Teleopsis dalmanni]